MKGGEFVGESNSHTVDDPTRPRSPHCLPPMLILTLWTTLLAPALLIVFRQWVERKKK